MGALDSTKTFIPENQIKVMQVAFDPDKLSEEFHYYVDPEGKQTKHGSLKEWYANGQLERSLIYDVGIKSGKEEWFYNDGRKKL